MKKITFLITLLFFTTSLFAQNDFLRNLENNNPKLTETVLIFHKPNCPYCEQMGKAISNDIGLQHKIKEKYNVNVIDISSVEGKKIAQLYNIKAVPTIVKYDEFQSFSILKGFGSSAKFLSFLGLEWNDEFALNTNRDIFSICANGVVESGEQCDDGNLINGDGCNDVCMFENSNCSNGIINAGEQCDDGNSINGDGCNMYCLLENGTCGNAVVNAGEQCDDGNNINGDGCNLACMIEGAISGNGVVESGEQCDDANTINGDGCNSIGSVEAGYSCVGSPSVCSVLGIDDNVDFFVSLKTYPNPFSNVITTTIYLKDASQIEMLLFDSRGKLIETCKKSDLVFGENEIVMNINDSLQSGLYFVKIQVSNSNGVFYETKKLIKE